MEVWVNLGAGNTPRWFTCPQTVTRLSSKNLIATRLEVRGPNSQATVKPPCRLALNLSGVCDTQCAQFYCSAQCRYMPNKNAVLKLESEYRLITSCTRSNAPVSRSLQRKQRNEFANVNVYLYSNFQHKPHGLMWRWAETTDAATVNKPPSTADKWRIHLCLQAASAACGTVSRPVDYYDAGSAATSRLSHLILTPEHRRSEITVG